MRQGKQASKQCASLVLLQVLVSRFLPSLLSMKHWKLEDKTNPFLPEMLSGQGVSQSNSQITGTQIKNTRPWLTQLVPRCMSLLVLRLPPWASVAETQRGGVQVVADAGQSS